MIFITYVGSIPGGVHRKIKRSLIFTLDGPPAWLPVLGNTSMFFQFDMSTSHAPIPEVAQAVEAADTNDLLRQLVEIQREQLNHLQAFNAAHDNSSRWRAFLARWRDDFSDLPDACKQSLPILERTYGKLITELTEHLCDNGSDALDNDFALQDFLDRFGMRLAQLGTILNLVGPLADASSTSEST